MNKNKILLLLLSIVIAFAMWMYVITVVSPESEDTFYNVPVVLRGEAVLEDRSLMLIMDEKPTVNLTLTGNRSDLNKLNSSNITVTAEISRIYEAGKQKLQYNVSFPGDVAAGAVTVKSRDPGSLTLDVERRIKDKPVDVVIESKGTVPASGFKVVETSLDREQIMITGPAPVVEKIAMARIDVNYTGRNKSFGEDYFITLCDEDGEPVDSKWVEVDYSSVYLTAMVHKEKTVPLDIKVIDGGGATRDTSEITLSVQEITVSGPAEDMKKFEETLVDGKLIVGTVDLAQYTEDTTLPPFEITLPEGIRLGDEVTSVTVDLKFPNLTVMEMLMQQVELINIPEGVRATVQPYRFEMLVYIRGPKDKMEKLRREDVKIVVDLTGAKPSDTVSTFAATVVVESEEVPTAGAIGQYPVAVDVKAG